MQIAFPSQRQWVSFGRHVVTFVAGAATAAAGLAAYGSTLHLVTPDQADNIVTAFQAIAAGVKAIIGGIGTLAGGIATLIGIGSGIWASYSASKKSIVQAAAQLPQTTVVTSPSLAAATPEANIVSVDKVAVVPK